MRRAKYFEVNQVRGIEINICTISMYLKLTSIKCTKSNENGHEASYFF